MAPASPYGTGYQAAAALSHKWEALLAGGGARGAPSRLVYLFVQDQVAWAAQTANWGAARLLLATATTLGWEATLAGWGSAFTQAPLPGGKPMLMRAPRGFKSIKHGARGCLKLRKALYGNVFAPLLWYRKLSTALTDDLGMKKSPHDQCLFYSRDLIIIVWTDGAIFAAPNKQIITDHVDKLKRLGFDLDSEGSLESYLGIEIISSKDGPKNMLQGCLIGKVIKASGMENCNPSSLPATQVALGKGADGPLHGNSGFRYPSAAGMLLCLSSNTRPGICFAASQACRLTHAPRKSHAAAVKMIIRYLAGTRTKGTIVRPDGTFSLKIHVGSDFSGLYGREEFTDPDSARSRLGYIISLGLAPLLWKPQLISEICLPTLRSECAALPMPLRAAAPPLGAAKAAAGGSLACGPAPRSRLATFKATVHEGNQGALALAKAIGRGTPRSKFYALKMCWLRSWLSPRRAEAKRAKPEQSTKRLAFLQKQ